MMIVSATLWLVDFGGANR